MAITRTQIAKQLLAKGGRIGFRIGSDEGDVSGREYGGSSKGNQNTGGSGNRDGRDPMAQFKSVRPTNPVDEVALTSSANRNFMRDARNAVTPIGDRLFSKVPFSGGIIGGLAKGALNLFSPSPFGFSSPKPVDFSGMDRGGDIPLWAQLGYSSEAEYLAAVARKSGETEQVAEGDSTEEKLFDDRFLRFRAEGGPIGGEYDFESARQMYGLGKLVKKVTRTVKKIAKSPIGKAALIGAAGFGIPGTSLGGIFGRASFGGFAPGMFGFGGIGNAAIAAKAKLFGSALPPSKGLGKTKGLLDFIPGGGVTAAIAGASALAGLLTPEQEEEAQELSRGEGIDIEAARRSILNAGTAQDFRARRFVAEGGSMKEPVAKKTMPLLDMGGKEMDLRAEGGFVPIGRMEKADDVPARLSKNEFVFTADAVRNAGDGDVDKGAEVMYNMMKNLEAGGDVSEESQGLEGARKMFQTSQRLEEVL